MGHLVRRLVARSLRATRATRADVDDLTQDVMLAAWEAGEEGRYRPDPDTEATGMPPLERWVRRLVYHRVDHHLRSARHRREELAAELPEVEHEAPSAERTIEAEQRRLAVVDALLEMHDVEGAAVVIAHDIHEIPMADLAEQYKVPLSTLYKLRSAALAVLVKTVRQRDG
ncbi:sigma-70 family RNA polymerase sigma factor [Sorangium sp. So ce429]